MIRALAIFLLVVIGCYVFPVVAGAVVAGGSWSHAVAASIALLANTVVSLVVAKGDK